MPRKLRSFVVQPGVPHHVILRGNNGRRLYSYGTCYRSFLRYLGDAARRTECAVHALALMQNHVHLVITPPDSLALTRCVKRTAQRYAIHRNEMLAHTGKLFEERFRAIPIESEAQLALTLAYVDLNPVRAGVVAMACQHRWSTYRLHVGEIAVEPTVRGLWTPHDWYIGLAADRSRRCELYREWVASRRAEDVEQIAATVKDRDDEATSRPRVKRPDDSRAG